MMSLLRFKSGMCARASSTRARKLMREVPALGLLSVWSNDSGAGFEFTRSLYVGANGSAYVVRVDDLDGLRETVDYLRHNIYTDVESALSVSSSPPRWMILTPSAPPDWTALSRMLRKRALC